MMKRILTTILLLSCLLLRASAQEGPVSRLDRDSILIGDQVRWSIDLSLAEGEEGFIEPPDDPVAQGVETIRAFRIDTVSARKGRLELEGNMILTAFDSGSFFLPPVIAMIQRTDGKVDTLFYDGPIIEVNTIPIDTATFKPYDIKGQIQYPLTFKEVAPWVLLALVVAAIVYVLVRYVRYRRQNRNFFGKPIEKEPAHIVALRSLDRIKGQKLWQQNKHKQFYTAVTDTLRQYIAETYDVSAMEQTSAEMFEDLKGRDIRPETFDRLKELFTTADYVKFAKHLPSEDENKEVIPTAVSFVNETYMQQVEAEKKEEKEGK